MSIPPAAPSAATLVAAPGASDASASVTLPPPPAKLPPPAQADATERLVRDVRDALARADQKTDERLAKVDQQLAALKEAIDANSLALGILLQDADARRRGGGNGAPAGGDEGSGYTA